jgi:hypothetical protein
MKFDIKKMTDVHKFVLSYVIAIAVFQAVFFTENVLVVIRTVSVLFWIFVIPGFSITYLWKLKFIERFALSVAISAALMGITSYYLGLLGLHVTISSVVLPVVYLAIGLVIIYRNVLFRK